MTTPTTSSPKKVITCLSEGKTTKNCNYKQLSITDTDIEQECRHCGRVRSVMRRKLVSSELV